MSNLVTIDDYKTYKGINSDNYDPIISLLIGSVSTFIKEYTGRTFIDYAHIDKVEYFDATFNPDYYPEEFPLQSVTEVAVSTDGGVSYTVLTENTDYFVDLKNDRIVSNTVYDGFVQDIIAHNSGRITYQGGYDTTPSDLKLAALDLVHYYRKEEYTTSKAIASASVNNAVMIPERNNLPPHIKRVLDNYRIL